ncbi:MAG TPA: hypothetical protein VFF69_16250 [Phycisphaerales bacterium]|nr:hypothetical protein [Phycisphaerales bacterium]
MPISRRELCARIALTAVAIGALAPASGLAPEPDPVPKRWQLEVEPGPLRVAYVESAEGSGAYLYLTYTATNNTGKDLEFVPSFEMATDSGEVAQSGVGVPPGVTDQIVASLEHPFLQDQVDILGPIQQGPENAKQGVVIWPLQDYRADEIRIFGAGFSGETDALELTDPRTGEVRRLVFRKTLMLRYATPGEIRVHEIGDRAFGVIEQRWIMR